MAALRLQQVEAAIAEILAQGRTFDRWPIGLVEGDQERDVEVDLPVEIALDNVTLQKACEVLLGKLQLGARLPWRLARSE